MERPGRWRHIAALALVIALAGLASPYGPRPAAAATNRTIASWSLSGSPFAGDIPPLPTAVRAHLSLSRSARVTVALFNSAGTRVLRLARRADLAAGEYDWAWDGRDARGAEMADGIYRLRVRVVNGRGVATASRPLRKGLPPIYPANPAAIVVVVDPGHGGRNPGAEYNGYAEKDFNLDIGLALQQLLEHAGVTVLMTRTTDTAVNEPISDINGDGLANDYDDPAARNDIANLARADLDIHVHNNAYGCRCARGTEMYTSWKRSWSPQGIDLATLIQREQIFTLDQFTAGAYFPRDRGVSNGRYYYMAPYSVVCPTAEQGSGCSPPYLPRPVLMPSVLAESLFVNNDIELELLKRSDVRIALAAAFYVGIAEWLNTREYGSAYELADGPAGGVTAGEAISYSIRVTNRGNTASDGWRLELRHVAAAPLYDGSPDPGTLLGQAAVPDGLLPGESVQVSVDATAPAVAGDWLVKTDIRLVDDTSFALMGIPALQVPLTTTAP